MLIQRYLFVISMLSFVTSNTTPAEPYRVVIQESGMPKEIAVGDADVVFTCTVSMEWSDQMEIFIEILWLHVSSLTQTKVQLTEGTLLNHGVSFSENGIRYSNSETLELTLKSVKTEHDGKFICRAVDWDSRVTVIEQEVELVVINDVESVNLTTAWEETVTSAESNAIQWVERAYNFTCKALGFNPRATIALFLGQQRLNPIVSDPTLDKNASTAAGARRYTMEASVTGYILNTSADGKAVQCVAEGVFQNRTAVPVTTSLPLQTITRNAHPALTPSSKQSALGEPEDDYLEPSAGLYTKPGAHDNATGTHAKITLFETRTSLTKARAFALTPLVALSVSNGQNSYSTPNGPYGSWSPSLSPDKAGDLTIHTCTMLLGLELHNDKTG
ncbi:hypothetical protein BaRGS_00020611 [Batillaria attramentaria]|uniref:Ig-like domain-containing protein n=1 Tax=Batillaria attramentaria TaxID=370345 RepID=A0ABD0KMA5_9CAEN